MVKSRRGTGLIGFLFKRGVILDSYGKYWEISRLISSDVDGCEANRHADFLNTKVGALLTHVSLMVVISTWFLTYGRPSYGIEGPPLSPCVIRYVWWVNVSLVFEVVFYIVITFLCLSAIWITHPRMYNSINTESIADETIKNAVQLFLREVAYRKFYYRIAIWSTFVTSVVFIVSIIIKFILLNAI